MKNCCDEGVPSPTTAQPGQKWTCPECKKRWVHDCDEAEGCGWYPDDEHKPGHPNGGTLTYKELVVACRNIGYDLTCGQCASVFYTGAGTNSHDPHCTSLTMQYLDYAELETRTLAAMTTEQIEALKQSGKQRAEEKSLRFVERYGSPTGRIRGKR